MKKILFFLCFIAIALNTYPRDYVDGYIFDEFEIMGFDGMSAPSVSSSGDARLYFDATANKLKLSENTGAYTNIIQVADEVNITDAGGYYTGTEVEAALQEIGAGTTLGGIYLKLDQTTPQTVSNDKPIFDSGLTVGSTAATILASGGTLTLGGTGVTYNENLTFDFESNSNQVDIASGTGATFLKVSGMRLLVQESASGQTAHTSADTMVLESSGNTAYSILSGANNTGAIVFGDVNDNWVGSITYTHNGDYLSAATNNVGYRWTLDSAGNFIVRGSTTGAGYHILYASGAATFNEQGASVDYRVEGNTITELLYVAGATDTVCIGGSLNAGRFNVNGTTFINDKLILTQTDGNEYIDSLNDGYIDYGATTGHRFNAGLIVTGNILPDVAGRDIGSTVTRFDGYFNILAAYTSLNVDGYVISNLLPNPSASKALGGPSNVWAVCYIDNITIDGASIVSGTGQISFGDDDLITTGIARTGKYEIDSDTTYIDKDGSNNMTFTDAVTGTRTLKNIGCPTYLYIKATAQAEGDLHLSDGTNWNVSKALIYTIRVETSSADWDMYILQNDNGYAADDANIPMLQIMEAGNGDANIQLTLPFDDEDDSGEVHIYYLDNDGADTADIYVIGTELI